MRLQTKVNSILLLSICTLLVNCSSEINHKLETVDKLLDQDSLQVAASLLQNINTSEIKTSKDSAYYLLLKTEIDWQKQKMKHKIQKRIYSIKVVHSVGSCAVKRNA